MFENEYGHLEEHADNTLRKLVFQLFFSVAPARQGAAEIVELIWAGTLFRGVWNVPNVPNKSLLRAVLATTIMYIVYRSPIL